MDVVRDGRMGGWTEIDAPGRVGVKVKSKSTREAEVLRSPHTLGEEKNADLRKDPDFMLEAVSRDILLFVHVSKELKEDPAFVLKVMERFSPSKKIDVLRMFRSRSWISNKSSSNRDFMIPIVRDPRFGLRAVEFIASEKLKADQEFMLEVLRMRGLRAIVHASDDLKANDKFMLEVLRIMKGVDAIVQASDNLKADQEFMLEVVRMWGAQAIVHASDDLKNDDVFMREVIRMCWSSTRGDTDVPQAIKVAFRRLMDKDPLNKFVNEAAEWGWEWNPSTNEPERKKSNLSPISGPPAVTLGEQIRMKKTREKQKPEEVFEHTSVVRA